MSISIIVTIIVLGVLLLLIEFLIIPGITVAGIGGTLMIIGGIFCGYYFHETPIGHYIMLATITIIISLFAIAFKTKTWQKLGLETTINSHIETAGSKTFNVGDAGKTVSRLAPIGKVMFNNIIVEARSMGGYIDPNTDVIIIRTEKNKLFVEPK